MKFPFPSQAMRDLSVELTVEDLMLVLQAAPERERAWLARQWLSEGIPFSFRNHPALFEAAREWLGARLDIDPKSVTMIGSGRTGFSMKPHALGRPFHPKSDLDFTIISESLFQRLETDVKRWMQDYEQGCSWAITTKTEENYRVLKRNIRAGFVDYWLVPYIRSYPTVLCMVETFSALGQNLKNVKDMSPFTKVTARVYKDWSSFVRQMQINFDNVQRKAVYDPSSHLVAPVKQG